MAVPEILTSLRGRLLGFGPRGRLISGGGAALVGNRGVVPVVPYTNEAASTAISNTVTETAFSTSYSIPAGTLSPGQLVRIKWQGIATATNATDTLAVKVYIGGITGTLLFTHAATDVANNDVFSGEYNLIVRTIGVSGTIAGFGAGKSIPAAEGTATYKDDILASTTIDTTTAKVIALSATWSVANAGNSCRLDFLSVEMA